MNKIYGIYCTNGFKKSPDEKSALNEAEKLAKETPGLEVYCLESTGEPLVARLVVERGTQVKPKQERKPRTKKQTQPEQPVDADKPLFDTAGV